MEVHVEVQLHLSAKSATGYMGVTYNNSSFRVQRSYLGQVVHLGSYPTAVEAAVAYAKHVGAGRGTKRKVEAYAEDCDKEGGAEAAVDPPPPPPGKQYPLVRTAAGDGATRPIDAASLGADGLKDLALSVPVLRRHICGSPTDGGSRRGMQSVREQGLGEGEGQG